MSITVADRSIAKILANSTKGRLWEAANYYVVYRKDRTPIVVG